jgi:pyruvate dehydrogenase E2 component (dihydrolipoamide acetyltransferase)
MATAVTMPRLGLSMVEGTVVEWRVRPGDPVSVGQVILDVESEKSAVEVEAFAAGVLATIFVEAGATVPIGTLLAAIVAPGEAFDATAFRAAFVPEVEGAPVTARAAYPPPRHPARRRRPARRCARPRRRAPPRSVSASISSTFAVRGPGGASRSRTSRPRPARHRSA